MGVGEVFLGVFIGMVIDKLRSEISMKSATISSKLSQLSDILSEIQPLIADAAQKQIRDEAVKVWLGELHQLAYDIDDLIDDLASNTTTAAAGNMLNRILPKFIMYDLTMSSGLDAITHKLQHLFRQKDSLGLDDVRRSCRPWTGVTTSLVDPSTIVGRLGDKEALMRVLLEGDIPAHASQNFSVLPILGMGGVGKTTLARVLYNDNKVKHHFELRVWVCVSHDFNVFDVTRAIYQSVGGFEKTFVTLDLLQKALMQQLFHKRFLLVLDGVSSQDHIKWQVLQRPFRVGAPASKIIVTTRNPKVASIMGSDHPYNLGLLSDDDAMSLFAQYSLNEQNFDSHPDLKLIAEGVIKKCGRLPLALKAFGGLLRTKTQVEEWEDLLNTDIGNLRDQADILPALRLSYHHLPGILKQLFAYCSSFPLDCVFQKHELVLLWMAEGFLYQSNGIRSMEEFGSRCFEELVSRSFLQHSTNDNQYIMPNPMRDLTMDAVGGDLFLRLDDEKGAIYESEILDKARHLSFVRQQFGIHSKFKALLRARRLRTLLAVPASLDGHQNFFLSHKVLIEIISQLQFLRVLNLSNYSISEIPQSIGSLKHLRYLNFSRTYIACLPEQVCDLYNLQCLLLCGCEKLFRLPKGLANLSKLRHLDISETPWLRKIPSGIGELKDLQTLSKVIIGGIDGFKISELKGLLDLQGQLSIRGLHNVKTAIQAKEAKLHQKKGLNDVELGWHPDFDYSDKRVTEFEVLEGLIPHHELRNLKIFFYGGLEFPGWVGDSSFVCLTELTLSGCRSCSRLPTLGHLKSLQKLFVSGMNEVKIVGSELLGPADSSNAFPSLQVLEFEDMQGWEIWSVCSVDNSGATTCFPNLGEISLVNCPKLDVVSVEFIESLRVLHIQSCPKAVLESMVRVSSSIVKLTMKNIIGLTGLHVEVLEHLSAVEYLSVKHCYKLEYLWETELEACKNLLSLSKLEVEYCKRLESLEEKESNLTSSMTSVKDMDLRNCESLKRCKCPNSIERLVIWDCPSIKSLTFPTVQGGFRSRLNILDIQRCDNLEESCLLSNFVKPLEYLEMVILPNLRSMPEGCFVHLTRLILEGCDHIESITEKGLDFVPLRSLQIISCMGLKYIPHEHFQDLKSLEELTIRNCPSLDYTFPCGLWPPNLRSLTIGGLKKPMSEWGVQNFPNSLVTLYLHGENSGLVSFGSSFGSSSSLLPDTLSFLEINGFPQLKSVSEGLQHLTNLKGLVIVSCPKLGDLPAARLSGLSSFKVYNCLELQERCHDERGKYWSIICEIPEFYV